MLMLRTRERHYRLGMQVRLLLPYATMAVCLGAGCRTSIAPSKTYIPTQLDISDSEPSTDAWSDLAGQPDGGSAHYGIVRRRTAVDPNAVSALVAKFFDAIGREDIDGLTTLMTKDATATDNRGLEHPLGSDWSTRFRRFDYHQVQGIRLYWQPDVTILELAEERLPSDTLPLTPTADSIIVRIPLERTRFDNRELFGQSVWLRLQQTADGLKILGYAEEY